MEKKRISPLEEKRISLVWKKKRISPLEEKRISLVLKRKRISPLEEKRISLVLKKKNLAHPGSGDEKFLFLFFPQNKNQRAGA